MRSRQSTSTTPREIITRAIERIPVLEREGDHLILATPDEAIKPRPPYEALFLLSEDAAAAAERAVDAVLGETDPDMARRLKALRLAFDDQWNDVEGALREAAFAVGYEYGRRLGAEGTK